jgi:hypothetical protein
MVTLDQKRLMKMLHYAILVKKPASTFEVVEVAFLPVQWDVPHTGFPT